jgi:type IX secretion system PorP/SprF family membrane protein
MKYFITLLFVLFISTLYAQQDVQYSHNLFNRSATNPAYAGQSNNINITLLHREQWMGFAGAPKCNLVNIETGFNVLGYQNGASLSILDDGLGFSKNFQFSLGYNFKLQLGQGTLGMGLNLGLMNSSFEANNLSAPENIVGDDVIPATSSGKVFDMGMGLFYNNDKFYVGLSSTHINQPSIDLLNQNNKNTSLQQKRHYFLTAGYNLQTPMPLLELKPSLDIQYDGVSYQLNVGTVAFYNRRFWAGAYYRHTDALVALIGLELKNGIKIGCAYDITISKFKNASNNSTEVFLGYSFSFIKEKAIQKYKSVRFL